MSLTVKQQIIKSITRRLSWLPKRVTMPVVAIVLVVGVTMTALGFSYGSVVSVEPEDGTQSGGAAVVADLNASGGQSLKFGGGGAFQSNCIVVPSACGYPDETNTGVPDGVTLTDSGSITVNEDGAVIDGLNITGYILVNANNVTIRNTRITSGDYYPIDYDGQTGLVVEDSEIIGTSHNVTSGLGFNNYTARRVMITGTADGFKADSNVLIEDSYVHNLAVNLEADTHNDGVQSTGGSNVTIRHSTFKLSEPIGVNAVLQLGTEWGDNSDWLVEDNLMDGGGWVVNAGPGGTNRVFNNNRFTRNSVYGIGDAPGMTWSGNYYDDDGSPVNE